jgi:hypothetical protein
MLSVSARFTPYSQVPLPDRLVERLGPLAEVLPDREPMELRTEADFYGASWEIARAIGLPEPPRAIASWFHGFIHRLASPHQFLWNDEIPDLEHHLVSKPEEAEFLRSHGRSNVHAVGAPFLYAPSPKVHRIPRSLLITPGLNRHLKTTYAEQFDTILESIRPMRSHFDVVLCCFKPRSLVSHPALHAAIAKHDVAWIEGAEFSDSNALRRMRALYSSFEVVMSDTVGAHLAQASLCGCRTCVFGPTPKLDRALLENAMYAATTHVREDTRMPESFVDNPEYYRERLPFLFRSPVEAGHFPEWGGAALGLDHVRTHAEIARLLGWHWSPQGTGMAGGDVTSQIAMLGWIHGSAVSPHALHEALLRLRKLGLGLSDAVTELQRLRKEHNSLAKAQEQAEARAAKLARKNAELQRLRRTVAWRLVGKHVHSVEKFFRRLLRLQ